MQLNKKAREKYDELGWNHNNQNGNIYLSMALMAIIANARVCVHVCVGIE